MHEKESKKDFGEIAAKTAKARAGLSVPVRRLLTDGYIKPNSSIFHHGRGKANADSSALARLSQEYAEYDPNYAPDRSVFDKEYDIVISNYVLNVLPPTLRTSAWKDIKSATSSDGIAYITVRNSGDASIKGERHKDGVITSTGTFQKGYTREDLVKEAKNYFSNVEIIYGTDAGISWTIAASNPKGKRKSVPKKKPDKKLDKQPEKRMPTKAPPKSKELDIPLPIAKPERDTKISVPHPHEVEPEDSEIKDIRRRAGIEK
jgi:hypothetical protein